MSEAITLELDRPRAIKFRYPELKEIQRTIGKPFGTILQDLAQLDVQQIETLLFIGLRHEDRTLRRERLEELLTAFFERGGSVRDLLYVLDQALIASGFLGRPATGAAPAGPST